ncbi:MAG: hypothetical protein C4522_10405 [Desulfobacteraceae bacterium]|nr:MAG: hypothetical protein C4522_10405 [Desulfobacteraceae bacterium]
MQIEGLWCMEADDTALPPSMGEFLFEPSMMELFFGSSRGNFSLGRKKGIFGELPEWEILDAGSGPA